MHDPLERSIDTAIADYRATWSQTSSDSDGIASSKVLKRSRLLANIIEQVPALLDAEQELDSLLASLWTNSRDWRPGDLALRFQDLKSRALSALEEMRLEGAADYFATSLSNAETVRAQLLSLQELSLQQDAIDETVSQLQRLELAPSAEAQIRFCSNSLVNALIDRPEAVDETLSLALTNSSACQLSLARSLDAGRRLRRLENIHPFDSHLGALLATTAESWKDAVLRSIDSASSPDGDPSAASPRFLEQQLELASLWSALWDALDRRAVPLAEARGFIAKLDAAVGPLPDLAAKLEQAERHAWLFPEGWEVSPSAGRDEHGLATEILAPQIDVTFVLIGVFPADRFRMGANGLASSDSTRTAVYLAKYPITVAVWQQHLGRTGKRATTTCHTALTLAPSEAAGGPTETWVIDPEATFLDPLPQLDFTAGAETPATLICWSSARAFCADYGFVLPTTNLWREGLRMATSVVEASSSNALRGPAKNSGALASVSMGPAAGPGLKDMGTIVREWCAADTQAESARSPSTRRPLMGGSWRLAEQNQDCSLARGDFAGPTVGFRPALLVPLELLKNPKLPTSEAPR